MGRRFAPVGLALASALRFPMTALSPHPPLTHPDEPPAESRRVRSALLWIAVPVIVLLVLGILAMVDVAAGLYSLSMEGEDLRLLPYAIAYRLFFITMVDVAKLFATVEEMARVPMTWGKLARVGRL